MTYSTIKLAGWKIKLADDFPSAFESVVSSSAKTSNGQRSSFDKLASSKFAIVSKFSVLFRAKVYNLVLKQYLNRGLLDILKGLICFTRAQKAFDAGQMLKQNGFLVPPAVACGRKFFITLEVQNSTPLSQLLSELSGSEKQSLIEQFGQTIGLMHNKGIFHGDLRLGNVLVKSAHCHFERSEAQSRNLFNKKDSKDKYDFIFLDNERTKKFDNLSLRLRIKNLVQINMFRQNITDEDRTCFLTSYLAQQQIPINKDKLAKKIESRTAKRLAAKGIMN